MNKTIEFEYRTQVHQMWLEGTADDEPTEEQIINNANENGYTLSDIEIWFDTMQKVWRFGADLKPVEESNQ